MSTPSAPADSDFELWLDDQLDTHLGVHAASPAPEAARYRGRRRRFAITPVRLGVAAAAAVLAAGGGAAYATGLVHGTTVSQTAASCSSGSGDSQGDCVSMMAKANTDAGSDNETPPASGGDDDTGTNNDAHGDAVSNAARNTCPRGPADAHGDCVSAIASGGRSGAHH